MCLASRALFVFGVFILMLPGVSHGQTDEATRIHAENKQMLWSQPTEAIEREKELLRDSIGASTRVEGYQVIAVGYSLMNKWDSATYYHLRAAMLADQVGDARLSAVSHHNLALLNLYFEDTLSALLEFEKARPYMIQQGPSKSRADFLRGLLLTYPPDSVDARIRYAKLAILDYSTQQDSAGMVQCYSHISQDYQSKNLDSSIYYAKLGIGIGRLTSHCDFERLSLDLANAYLGQKRTNEAILVLREAVQTTNEESFCPVTGELYKKLSDMYEKEGDFKNAFLYSSLYYELVELNKVKDEWSDTSKLSFDSLRTALIDQARSHHMAIIRYLELSHKADREAEQFQSTRTLNFVIIVACIVLLITLVYLYIQRKRIRTRTAQLEQSLTELKQTREQLIQQEKLASLGTLAAGMAHEINNPLNFISGSLHGINQNVEGGIENPALKSETLELIKMAKQGVNRATSIVQGLLQFSRKKDALELKPHNVGSLIDKALVFLQSEITQHQVDVIQSASCWENYIHCDETAFLQIAINLIMNALHATEPQGRISILCTQSVDGSKTEVHFNDTGSGIPVSELQRIFNPFHTTKEVGRGTGLGLSICYNLMSSMNGKIRVHSEVGTGSDFILEFPRIQS